jgi:GTP:adenosylcobinamide-phosphate guanylyltransferase
MSEHQLYNALVLAAGRGAEDPMAKEFNITHKCLVKTGGKPMLTRVITALESSPHIGKITICIDDPAPVTLALGAKHDALIVKSANSAPASVLSSIADGKLEWPVLVTTADHALLTPEMINHFVRKSAEADASLTVGLANQHVIEERFPQTKRTYLPFADQKVSGCNLFMLYDADSLKAVAFWRQADQNRKKPWKLVGSFGLIPLLSWALGRLSLAAAFQRASKQLGVNVKPVLMPFAEAAIDVDKPQDKELVDRIFAGTA